jgi:hypothetical protein
MDRDRLAGTAGPRDDGMDEALRALSPSPAAAPSCSW